MEEKAKRGRPRVPIDERLNVHICLAVTERMAQDIRSEAKRTGTNMSRFIMNAVAEKLTQTE